jgi:hypothetical protein
VDKFSMTNVNTNMIGPTVNFEKQHIAGLQGLVSNCFTAITLDSGSTR